MAMHVAYTCDSHCFFYYLTHQHSNVHRTITRCFHSKRRVSTQQSPFHSELQYTHIQLPSTVKKHSSGTINQQSVASLLIIQVTNDKNRFFVGSFSGKTGRLATRMISTNRSEYHAGRRQSYKCFYTTLLPRSGLKLAFISFIMYWVDIFCRRNCQSMRKNGRNG